MPPDRTVPYRAEDLNVAKLERYAKRVASETARPSLPSVFSPEVLDVVVQRDRYFGFFGLRHETIDVVEQRTIDTVVLPCHWELFSRNRWVQETEKYVESEYVEEYSWVLTDSGSLLFVRKWEEYRRPRNATRGDQTTGIEARPMTPEKMLELDHVHTSFDRRDGGVHQSGNGVVGPRNRHAPGVGLSLALKQLLQGS